MIKVGLDIGACVTQKADQYVRLDCLEEGLIYCCQVTNLTNLLYDSGQRVCCDFDDYLDGQWAVLGFLEIGTFMIIAYLSMLMIVFFIIVSYGIKIMK